MHRLASNALPLALLLSCTAQACLDDGSLILRGEERIEFTDDAPLLLRLQQWNEDLRIHVEGPSPRWVNGPGGRSGSDYLFLEATEGTSVALCLYSTYAHAAPGHYHLSLSPVAPQAEESVHYRLLDQAGQLWHEATPASQKRAREVYAQVASAGLEAGISRDAALQAALAASRLNRHTDTTRFLQTLLAAGDDRELRYRVSWLQGQTALRAKRPAEAGVLLSAALSELEAENAESRADFRYDSAEIRVLLAEAQIGEAALAQASATLDQARVEAAPDFRLLALLHTTRAYPRLELSERPELEQGERQYHLARATDEHLKALYFAEPGGYPA